MKRNRKKKAPRPARPAPSAPPTAPAPPTADPWAVEKVSRVSAQRICQACERRENRDRNGVWRVGPAALGAIGYAEDVARRWLEEAQAHKCDPALEGGVVVARSGRGVVTVRSTAERPAAPLFQAAVREPCALRCGDEVAVMCHPSGTREVVHGR